MTQDGPRRKPRHRRRATAAAGPPQPPAAAPQPATAPAKAVKKTPPKAAPAKRPGDRGLRDLVGAGSTQLGVSRALRARDVNRPTEQDLAAAETELQIVRRNWKPES